MAHKTMVGVLALAFAVSGMAPAFSQGILDRMKEDAARRAENKAARDAENPPPAKQADSAATPATPAAAAQPAAAQPAAAPAAPARTPAPAQ